MDKKSKYKKLSRIENQLALLDVKKKGLLKDLYNSYEIYLTEVRSEIFHAVSKGILELGGMTQRRERKHEDKITFLINNEIKLLIDQLLPFLTIEQLSLLHEKNENNTNPLRNNQLSDEICFNPKFPSEDLNYKNYCNYYYGVNSNYNLENSVDLDNKHADISKKLETIVIEGVEEKYSYTSSKYLYRNEINPNNSGQQINNVNIFEENQLSTIIEWSELIDVGLSLKLKKISIEINNIFFSNIFPKEIMPENLVHYLFENYFLTTNPRPFVAKLDLLSNEYIYSDDFLKNISFSKIYLFCINPTELEFNNINLNIARNKIRNLKNIIRSLIKKEQYWSSKKLYSNYDLYKVYKK